MAHDNPRKEKEMTRFFDEDDEAIQWARRTLGIRASPPKPEKKFVPFFGQQSLKNQIQPFLDEPVMPPVLLFGEPGMGKNAFVEWIANERLEPVEELVCPISPGTPFSDFGIIFLDEVHLLKKPEWLFRRMESRTGSSIIAATTRPERLDPAFKSRFFIQLYFKPYTIKDMKNLVRFHLSDASEDVVEIYAGGSAGNPRQAMRIVETAMVMDVEDAESVMKACRITGDGINDFQLRYLQVLSNNPVGLEQVALLMYADKETIRLSERFLIHLGLVELTPNGRKLTRDGQRYVDFIREV